jgi:AbrB family looped-hinge helix DNA binding protein
MSRGTVRVRSNGRLVIPASYRKALGVGEGDELIVRLEGGELRLSSRKTSLKRAQERVRRYVPEGVALSDELVAERREEAAE